MSHHLSYLNLEKPLLLTDSDKVKNSWTMELSSMAGLLEVQFIVDKLCKF